MYLLRYFSCKYKSSVSSLQIKQTRYFKNQHCAVKIYETGGGRLAKDAAMKRDLKNRELIEKPVLRRAGKAKDGEVFNALKSLVR